MSEAKRETADQAALRLAKTYGPLAALLGATAAGMLLGPATGVLVLAASVLIAAIATMWTSLRAALGDTPLSPEDAFALGAPSTEEEQKRAVLRAIKDVEFEHSVGKISDADYRELVDRYRAEAKRLLRQIDERSSPERLSAEQMARKRLVDAGLLQPDVDELVKAGAKKKKKKRQKATASCPGCGAGNDVDAAFCKACGKPMKAAAEAR